MTLAATVSELGAVTRFVRQGALQAGLSEPRIGEIELVVEEVFLNVCRYAYPAGDPGPFTLEYDVPEPGRLEVEVTDRGIAFNPLEAPPPEIASERRRAGGFGILLARSFSDSFRYVRREGSNRLTFGIRADR